MVETRQGFFAAREIDYDNDVLTADVPEGKFELSKVLKELNPEMLARFTQIDYDREIALVAIDEDSGSDNILGVARIIGDADGRTGEFAVLVADAWQGKGIGGNLLAKCLSIAEKQGFKEVHGIVLQENRNMLALGKKLGFETQRDLDAGDNQLVIHFDGGRD